MNDRYLGQELELFARALRWKGYMAAQLRPYLHGEVLEVGAGLGATTAVLCDGSQRQWVCLEPDAAMATRLGEEIAAGRLPACCRAVAGDVAGLDRAACFDAILYVDVLEHIEDDAAELDRAASRLRPSGVLAVVSPAHPWLYSPFDAAIGHHRRYTARSLAAAAPARLQRVVLRYLDAVGLVASGANRLLLRQRMPTAGEIALWDGWMVPLSRRLDPLLRYRAGKSILGIWRAPGTAGRR